MNNKKIIKNGKLESIVLKKDGSLKPNLSNIEYKKPQKKYKLIAYCDSPVCHSGFGQVAKNMLNLLYKTGLFDITVFGLNHYPDIDDYGRQGDYGYPYEIIQASYLTNKEIEKGFTPDYCGKQKFLKYIYENEFDILWSVQDPYVVEFLAEVFNSFRVKLNRKFKSILYFPVDAANISRRWATIPECFDFPVVYTEFGKQEVLKKNSKIENKLEVIYHGTNIKDFKPIDDTEKKEIRKKLGIAEEDFVVLNVNRNQGRKDLPRTLHVFSEFKKEVPKSKLFLFCKSKDIGGNLEEYIKYYNLNPQDIVFPAWPKGGNDFKGLPVEDVNRAYNISDLTISTTLGEGHGLSLTESMATKTPVLFPSNSAITEIIGKNEERGFLAKCGSTKSEYIHLHGLDDDPPRPLVNIESMVEKMLYIWKNRDSEEVKKKVENAYLWTQNNTWKKIFERQWLPIFKKAIEELEKDH
jgi:glycosyltransferase involved in cell wall biosynthesis